MNKKIITILALALVIVAAIFVCTSCAKKEEAKEENIQIHFAIENQTGEVIKEIKMEEKETAGEKQTWNMANIAAGTSASMTISTAAEKGAPNVTATFTTESGQSYTTQITTKGDKAITLKKDENGSFVAEVTSK